MPYKNPERQKQFKKEWKKKNAERVKAQNKKDWEERKADPERMSLKQMGKQKRLERNKLNELCTDCSSPVAPDRTKCQKCLDKDRERRDDRREKGLCLACPEPPSPVSPGKAHCEACVIRIADGQRSRIEDRKSLGICVQCSSSDKLPATNYCVVCYLKNTAGRVLGSTKRWQELLDLFQKQNGVCPYFGCQLTLGEDTWIDHIVAVTKGGTSDIPNLQWTHWLANQMKWNQTEEEFVENCMRVVVNKRHFIEAKYL